MYDPDRLAEHLYVGMRMDDSLDVSRDKKGSDRFLVQSVVDHHDLCMLKAFCRYPGKREIIDQDHIAVLEIPCSAIDCRHENADIPVMAAMAVRQRIHERARQKLVPEREQNLHCSHL